MRIGDHRRHPPVAHDLERGPASRKIPPLRYRRLILFVPRNMSPWDMLPAGMNLHSMIGAGGLTEAVNHAIKHEHDRHRWHHRSRESCDKTRN